MKTGALLSKAIRIAAEAFEGRLDAGGHPYILHCLHVMTAVKNLGDDAMIIGVLHDLLEDTTWTARQLLDEGFSEYTVDCLKLLSHSKDEDYMTYIKYIATCRTNIPVQVKLADLQHNSDITRLKGLTQKDFARLEKYCYAYTYLKDVQVCSCC